MGRDDKESSTVGGRGGEKVVKTSVGLDDETIAAIDRVKRKKGSKVANRSHAIRIALHEFLMREDPQYAKAHAED